MIQLMKFAEKILFSVYN